MRHGASAHAVPGEPFDLIDGHADPALAPEGIEQADRVAQRLAGEAAAALFVTPLRRTAQTAAPIARRLGLEPVVIPDLREVALGEWEGGELRIRAAHGDPLFSAHARRGALGRHPRRRADGGVRRARAQRHRARSSSAAARAPSRSRSYTAA